MSDIYLVSHTNESQNHPKFVFNIEKALHTLWSNEGGHSDFFFEQLGGNLPVQLIGNQYVLYINNSGIAVYILNQLNEWGYQCKRMLQFKMYLVSTPGIRTNQKNIVSALNEMFRADNKDLFITPSDPNTDLYIVNGARKAVIISLCHANIPRIEKINGRSHFLLEQR